MTPSARLAAAITVLERWITGENEEKALTAWARGARYAGSKDRAAVRDHVFEVLRRKGNCAVAGGGETARALVLGLSRLQGHDVRALFAGEGHGAAALTDNECALLDEPLPASNPALDLPDWISARLVADHGDAAAPIAAALAERAPLYLRVNIRKTTLEQCVEGLSSSGVTAERLPGCATALKVIEGARQFRNAPAYADGLVEIQDLSVQRACAAIRWPQTGRILDYCAGGGGKALAIAATSEAAIFVHDANPARMADLPARAARAGVTLTALGTAEAQSRAPFDLVLVDVPCSGSGTWRRDPGAKWRLTEGALDELVAVQRDIMEQSQRLVARGGRLVYMTCSLFALENQGQIKAFLERHPDWTQTALHRDTPLTASDGFFCAELTRSS